MAKPLSVERMGDGLLIRLDDGTRYRAIEAPGEFWVVSAVPPPPPPPPPPPTGPRFAWPFPLNQVTSEYGQRNGRLHAGIDFGRGSSNVEGTPIPCAAVGRVLIANRTNSHGGYGNAVVVNHGNGLHTLYGHMSPGTVRVNVGDRVSQGTILGGIGHTGRSFGNHLHFETHEGGYRWDASSRNPREFFARWNK